MLRLGNSSKAIANLHLSQEVMDWGIDGQVV